jgi:hypothetical protein
MCLLNIWILSWIWQWAEKAVHIPWENGWVQTGLTFVRWGITFVVMVVSYRFYHYLLRIPGIRQLFYYTSFTRYKFWRRYRPSRTMISKLP